MIYLMNLSHRYMVVMDGGVARKDLLVGRRFTRGRSKNPGSRPALHDMDTARNRYLVFLTMVFERTGEPSSCEAYVLQGNVGVSKRQQ